MIDSTEVLFHTETGFIDPLQPQKAEDWVPPDAQQPLSSAVRAGYNPRHLYSHLSTHIHITKAAVLGGGTICMLQVSMKRREGEKHDFTDSDTLLSFIVSSFCHRL